MTNDDAPVSLDIMNGQGQPRPSADGDGQTDAPPGPGVRSHSFCALSHSSCAQNPRLRN